VAVNIVVCWLYGGVLWCALDTVGMGRELGKARKTLNLWNLGEIEGRNSCGMLGQGMWEGVVRAACVLGCWSEQAGGLETGDRQSRLLLESSSREGFGR